MDLMTALLLALCTLFVATLCLGALLVRRNVTVSVARKPAAPAPPRPVIQKCNMRRWSFARETDEGTENAAYEVHPHCDGVPFDVLSEDYGRYWFQRQHENEDGWVLVGMSDHVHFLKP